MNDNKGAADTVSNLSRQNEVILNSAGEGIFGLSAQGMTTFANPAAARMLGWKVEEMLGQYQHGLIHHSHEDGTPYRVEVCPIYAALHDGQIYRRQDEVFWRKDGSCFPVEYISTPIKEDDGTITGAVLIFQDITERKIADDVLKKAYDHLEAMVDERTFALTLLNQQLESELSERKKLESQLVQAQKMESLGQLAAGVAHEINNPMGFVMSNLGVLSNYVVVFKQLLAQYDQLAKAIEARPPIQPYDEILTSIKTTCPQSKLAYILEDIDNLLLESTDGAKRIQEIVQGLKSFARLDEAELKEANINECLESTLKIIWNELKYKCQVHKRLGAVPSLQCYPGQLNQVFLNLLVNAAQAIPEQGEIFIETQVRDNAIVIQFRDTGAGIPPETLPHIFEPFFTTKSVGIGTGLGLSISYGIIQKHHGTIHAQSVVGEGTTFTISLPLTDITQNRLSDVCQGQDMSVRLTTGT